MNEEENNQEEPPLSKEELETLKEFKEKYLHLLADGQNARKRMQKEREEIVQYAAERIILELLHPLDHLENALRCTDQASSEVQHWATGFQMILNQFKDLLANNGVKQIEAKGLPFDPNLHEAVEMVETDEQPKDTVVEVLVRGYRIGDKTLRPARVKVAKPTEDKELNQNKGV